jgi:hypothetical protein
MIDDYVLEEVLARVTRADYERWAAGVQSAGYCAHPVRLSGSITTIDASTGEVELAYASAAEPDGILYKACRSRRATRCPSCAAIYRTDARVLVLTGLFGGKGVPEEIADHPVVFVTITAPSFGSVHTCHPDGPHGSTTAGRPCRHGRPLTCAGRHQPDDPLVGTPVCPDCYDYEGTILWNARAGELWRRTVINAHRSLARLLELPVRVLRRQVRLSFIKVVEYQRRGVVHVHALIRLDDFTEHGTANVNLLGAAVHLAASSTVVPNPYRADQPICWGDQLDVIPISADEGRNVAAYLAKYSTKSTEDAGTLDHRLKRDDLQHLDLSDHHRRLVHTAWRLGGGPALAKLHLRRWAHTFGYRGHWLTKSRHWSTTFAALRQARHQWRLERDDNRNGSGQPEDDLVRIGEWTYAGSGYQSEGDSWLAASAAKQHQQNRRIAWEERP